MEQIQYIPLDKIEVGTQVRKAFDEEAIDGLVASLKAVGQLQPIRVRKVADKFRVVCGERRTRAARLAGLTTLAAIIEVKDLSEGEVLQRQIIENCQRENLCPIEKARGITRLMEVTGWKIGEAAIKLGMSAGMATKLLGVLKLSETIQQQVASGAIAVSAAYELSRVDDAAVQSELAGELAAGRLNRDGLAGAIKARSRTPKAVTPALPSRVTAALPGGKSVTVVGPALDLESFIEILDEILNQARKVRHKGIELGTLVKMLRDQAMQLP